MTAVDLDERTDEEIERERFEIRRLLPTVPGHPRQSEVIATTPDCGGLGLALVTLRDEGEIEHDTRVGIRDAVERKWLINPYARGGK